MTRLSDYYLHTTAAAMDTLFPAERHRRPHLSRSARLAPPMTGPPDARAWLDGQQANLVAIVGFTAGHGWPGHAIRLAAILFRYLDAGGHYSEAATIHICAGRAACAAGDRLAEATALNGLGAVDLRQGRYQQAASHLQLALNLRRPCRLVSCCWTPMR